MSTWEPPAQPGRRRRRAPGRHRRLGRRFLKIPMWGWIAGAVGLIVIGAALPDPETDTTVRSEGGPAVQPEPVIDAPATTALPDGTTIPTGASSVDRAATDPPAATSATTSDVIVPVAPMATTVDTITTTTTTTATATIAGSVRALDVLAFIVVENEHQDGYDRELFAYPGDLDGDGCDTRDEVLARDSLNPVQVDVDGCTVVAGGWYSSYDDTMWSDPGEVQIDHVVALKEAWDSGAWAWDVDRQQRFGNDLLDRRTLRVVSAAGNAAKGEADPSNRIPSNPAAVCGYLADWVAIKVRWTLSMDESEFGRIRNLLTERCPDQLIEPWPDTPPPAPPSTTAPPTPPPTVVVTTQALQPFIPSVPAAPPAGDCDPSYPGVCIPSGPPDLDCGDIQFRRFAVVGSDPHGFDGNDNDGIGCESG